MIADDYDETSQEARHWQTTILDSLDMLLKIFFWKKFLHILTFYGKKFVWKNLEFMSKEDRDEASDEEARHWQTTTLDSLDMLSKT